LNEILGERPSIKPTVVIDSSSSSANTSVASTIESYMSKAMKFVKRERPDNQDVPLTEGQTPRAEESV